MVLKDDRGNRRAWFGMEGQSVSLRLLDGAGEEKISYSASPEAAALSLLDDRRCRRAQIAMQDGQPALLLLDPQGAEVFHLSLIFGEAGDQQSALASQFYFAHNQAYIRMSDSAGRIRVGALVEDDSPSIYIFNSSNAACCRLRVAGSEVQLGFLGAEGETAGMLSVEKSNYSNADDLDISGNLAPVYGQLRVGNGLPVLLLGQQDYGIECRIGTPASAAADPEATADAEALADTDNSEFSTSAEAGEQPAGTPKSPMSDQTASAPAEYVSA